MSQNSFTVLGSGSGLPQANRATSGYLLKTGESLTLIDCGGGVTSSLLRRGYDPLKVDRVFISHTHPDHCCELPLFIQLIYLKRRIEPLEIYVPSEFVEPLKNYLNAVYLIPQKYPVDVNIIGVSEGFTYDGDFKLTARENNHLKGHVDLLTELRLPNRMQCFSFVVEIGDRSIVYSSDIASFDDIRPYASGRDLVIVESTHIDLGELLEAAQTSGVGQYLITHLGTDEEVAEIHRLAEKAGVDNLSTAVDGMVIDL